MAGITAALTIGSAALSAVGSISQGIAANKQAEANAQIYEAQAKNIAEAQKITASQYRTKENQLRGKAIANAARSGLKISGSTANSISQSIMQLQMDNSYEQFNLQTQKINAYNNAELQRYQGRQALTKGFINAGTTALNAGSDYYNKYWGGTSKIKTNRKLLSGGIDTSNSSLITGPTSAFA